MKRTAYVQFRTTPDNADKIVHLFQNRVDHISIEPTGLEVTLNAETQEFTELLNELERESIQYRILETREYTKQEMKAAEFFDVGVYYPWEHDALKDAEYYGTKYEYVHDHRCEFCGKIQASELKLDVKKIGTKHFVN